MLLLMFLFLYYTYIFYILYYYIKLKLDVINMYSSILSICYATLLISNIAYCMLLHFRISLLLFHIPYDKTRILIYLISSLFLISL